MASSSCRPVGITWEYDRVELIADGIVHALGVSLGLGGAIAIVILTANSIRAADTLSVVIYTIGLLTMLGFSAAYNLWPISRAKLTFFIAAEIDGMVSTFRRHQFRTTCRGK